MSTKDEPAAFAVANRILQLKQDSETDAEFGRRVGLTSQVLSNYRAKLHGASLEAVITVAASTDVSLEWLVMGTGPRQQPPGASSDPYVQGVRVATDRMLAFLAALRDEYGLGSEVAPSTAPGERGQSLG